jgi:8-oxo-dGTP pyrophosphatase MutT (NUDIX family)
MTRKKRLRSSAVCTHDGKLLVVWMRDPVSGVLAPYPPGGAIEPGESAAEAARRETLEETGLDVDVDAASELVAAYPFTWAGNDVDVTTHFFRAALRGPAELHPVIDADYNLGAAWLTVEEAMKAFAVHPPIADAVSRLLAASRAPR